MAAVQADCTDEFAALLDRLAAAAHDQPGHMHDAVQQRRIILNKIVPAVGR